MNMRWVLVALTASLYLLTGCSQSEPEQVSQDAMPVTEEVAPEVTADVVLNEAEVAWDQARVAAEEAYLKIETAAELGQVEAGATYDAAMESARLAMESAAAAWENAQRYAVDEWNEIRLGAANAFNEAMSAWEALAATE